MPHPSDPPLRPLEIDEKAHLAARSISLYRGPTSPNAQACVQNVLALLTSELDTQRQRKLGQKAQERLLHEVGTLLAGLLHRSLSGVPVLANKRPSAALWKENKAKGLIGFRAFWGKMEALIRLGLVMEREAMRFEDPRRTSGIGGKAVALMATPALLDLARQHGCTQQTRSVDWRLIKQPDPPRGKQAPVKDAVVFHDFPDLWRGRVKKGAKITLATQAHACITLLSWSA
ncbi:hypothetical protein [Swingsia samuiensis]|uniref:Uncharacterized protein n=1 Tax=Swingsia samuiensis TaxID=1293412 RepID=A0A4Y6UGX9_9PROT|nr:hypothetical protein [Swingsia samuiensis]QDH16254.1 hypothetical protein E3D00_00695 [Swingsia samuiensis]QDH17781.1 hypothetical protein E3D00_09530 [Swingsia samuiensis]